MKIYLKIQNPNSEIKGDEEKLKSMINELIENAIKHGLAHKPGGGHIETTISKEGETHLKLTVADNGVGRKHVKTQKKEDNHISRALSITAHRLQLLEQQTEQATQLMIEDIHPEEAYTGTRVILILPLMLRNV